MNIADLFIRRPIMTTLVMASILLFGIIGYRQLPVSDLPNVDFPTIEVSASLPGANPETMASAVATPLEKEFATISGVDSMSSTSGLGATRITLQFALDRNIDAAAQDVQSAISRATRRLPSEMPSPPSFRKVNPADMPILYFALTSPTAPMSVLDEFGQTVIAQNVSMVEGVAQVQVFGSQKYAVRIELDPAALATRGIGIDEAAAVVAQYNVSLPVGSLSGPDKVATIQTNGQLLEAEKYVPLIVAFRDGKPVRLSEIGKVSDSVENDKVAAWFTIDGVRERAIVLAVQKQPGANTVKVANAVKALVPGFREKTPDASIRLHLFRDASEPIRESAQDVQFTLLLTLALVVMVIFLFLRNVSATVIPSMTLPMSIVGTFGVMYLLGYSLDNLSLMALTLSVGFVVDDAIVMLENIVRHMEMGKDRMRAAFDGAREISFTIISMTLSLAAVFIPVLFMGGIVGKLFQEFAVTIGVAVLVSGVVSLTLTPMMCSRLLRDTRREGHGRAWRATEAAFQGMLRFYDRTLRWVLRHHAATMLVSAGILVATVWLFMAIPKGFIPSEDRDQISIQTDVAQDASFDSLVAHQLQLADIVQDNPNVSRFMCSAGGGVMSTAQNAGRMFVVLKPRSERKATADEVVAELRGQLARVPGIRSFVSNPPPINVGGRAARSLYQLTLLGTDTDSLYRFAADLEERIRTLPEFVDVSSDMQLRNPQLKVEINRDQAFYLGVTPLQIENALYTAYGTRQISTIYAPNNQYQVIMELLPEYQMDAQALSMLYVRSSKGTLAPLSAMTTLSEEVGPLTVNHSGQLPSVTISFNLKPGVSLGQAVDRLRAGTLATLPAGLTYSFQGTAQAFQSSLKSLNILLLLAIVVIYIVLGILYESFWHPLTILSALPFAGFGALATLILFNAELSIYAFVGVIMLVGLVKKNGIMMVDFAIEAQRVEGKSAHDAIHQACLVRFRPIMMTTLSALMGAIPLAMGWGAGAESRRPLGLAVVGGLLFSQTLTLYVTPVFFLYMERFRTWVAGLIGAGTGKEAGESAPASPGEGDGTTHT